MVGAVHQALRELQADQLEHEAAADTLEAGSRPAAAVLREAAAFVDQFLTKAYRREIAAMVTWCTQ